MNRAVKPPCTCGTCRSCLVRAAWAAGKYQGMRRAPHRDAWTAPQEDFLRKLAGTGTPAQIAEVMTERYATPRTENAIRLRLKHLGLSAVVNALTATHVGLIFGVDVKVVTRWLAAGLLQADRVHAVPGGAYVFQLHHLEAFIRGHLEVFDWRIMRPGRWRSLAEVEDRKDPYLTLDEASASLGMHPYTLGRWCREGRVPHVRRFCRGGARHGRIIIRRSALRQLQQQRPRRVAA